MPIPLGVVIGAVFALNESMEKSRKHRLLLLLALTAFAGGLLISWYWSAEEARHEISCANNLKQIGLGLSNYPMVYHCLPLAAELGSDGRLWRSWRTQTSEHRKGPLVCFADGEVYHLSPETTEPELKAMLTIAGNEGIRRQDLIKRGLLFDHPGNKNR